MKIIRFTAFALLLAISFTVLVGCDDLRMRYYDPEIYDYRSYEINPEFASKNKTLCSYEKDDPERANAPIEMTFTIDNETDLVDVFGEIPFEVDFDREIVYIYTYGSTFIHKCILKNISVSERTVKIEFGRLPVGPTFADSCMPYQRWIVVKMKKTCASNVEFALI